MATINDLRSALEEFNRAVNVEKPVHELLTSSAVLTDPRVGRTQSWSGQAGIYVILEGNEVRYVGRALKGQGLATRLAEQLRAGTQSAVRVALSHPNSAVYVVPLADADAWLAPSLELLAHARPRGDRLLNRKRS